MKQTPKISIQFVPRNKGNFVEQASRFLKQTKQTKQNNTRFTIDNIKETKTLGFIFKYFRNQRFVLDIPFITLYYKDAIWTSGTEVDELTVGALHRIIGSPKPFRLEYWFNPEIFTTAAAVAVPPPKSPKEKMDESFDIDPNDFDWDDPNDVFRSSSPPPRPTYFDDEDEADFFKLPSPLWSPSREDPSEESSSKRNRIECKICFETNKPLSTCAGCKKAIYCGTACQRKDWKMSHSLVCSFFSSCSKTGTQGTSGDKST